MEQIRYLHASDLQLGAPFRGIPSDLAANSRLNKILREASFMALERLAKLCEIEKPDFVAIAGNMYNQEERGIQAQLRMRDFCLKLKDLGIKVYIARGSLDPSSSQLAALQWPDNVVDFAAEAPTAHVFEKNSQPAAIIHGISYSTEHGPRPIAQMFKRDPAYDCFQLGIIHCSAIGSERSDSAIFADEFVSSGLDAWALGCGTQANVLREDLFIACSGSLQGLACDETGQRGCLLVTATPCGGSWRCESEFRPLAPVQWEILNIDINNLDSIDDLENRLHNVIEKSLGAASGEIQGMLIRPRLQGQGSLDAQLRKSGVLDELAEKFRSYANNHPAAWLTGFDLETTGYISQEEYLKRDDLLGEIMRLCRSLDHEPRRLAEISEDAFAPLFANSRYRHCLQTLSDKQKNEILNQAERLCQDILEAR